MQVLCNDFNIEAEEIYPLSSAAACWGRNRFCQNASDMAQKCISFSRKNKTEKGSYLLTCTSKEG